MPEDHESSTPAGLSRSEEECYENFILIMRDKLEENVYKGGWFSCSNTFLFQRLIEEAKELEEVLRDHPNDHQAIAREAADVANIAMMLADPRRLEGKG